MGCVQSCGLFELFLSCTPLGLIPGKENKMSTSQRVWRGLAMVLAAAVIAACGGGGGSAAIVNPPPIGASINHRFVSNATVEAAGSNCPNGGARIDSGFDANNNGVLDASEIAGTPQYVCNATNGLTALVSMTVEPAGATNCVNGGYRVQVGADSNGNGALDSTEVSSTQYVCNGTDKTSGANATVLMAIVSEPAGNNCAYGGNKISSGPDGNNNNVLDTSEVTATTYLCNGPPTGIVWVRTSTDVQALPNSGYLTDSASLLTVTLPASPATGDIVAVNGVGTGGWKIAQNAGQSINLKSLNAMAGAVWKPTAFSKLWLSIASSADGNKLVAIEDGGQIYTSADGGANWTARDSVRSWYGVASSADGNKLVAVVYGGNIYTSANSGINWVPQVNAGVLNWNSVASSSDGTKLVATVDGGQIYSSADSGVTWAPTETARRWSSVASSAAGNKLVAAEDGGLLYTSSNGGTSWTPRQSVQNWRSVASSADGSKLLAASFNGQLYTSADSGVTWTGRESSRAWVAVTSSTDGTRLVAVVAADVTNQLGLLYTSADSGISWVARGSAHNWSSVASSADGIRLFAVDYGGNNLAGGFIYTSDATTTPGAAGFLGGAQFDTVELQYVWDGFWNIRKHEGSLTGF
jgi:hypothetical protein